MNEETTKTMIDELLLEGSVTLTGKERQDIYDQSKTLVDSIPEGIKWTRSICQYHPDTFSYSQEILLIKN